MKIILIDPPYSSADTGGRKRNFGRVINKIPSLGLGYLAAVLEKAGHRVSIVDCAIDFDESGLIGFAGGFGPDIVGFTSTTPVFGNALRLARRLRPACPSALFVCGGAHATADPEGTLREDDFDIAVIGEGEESFLELANVWRNGGMEHVHSVKGIAFRSNGSVVSTGRRGRIADLDALPFPARHLFAPLERYRPTPASYRRLPLGVVMTSRGCPSGCVFCDRAVFGEELRLRDPKRVLEEVEELISRYGAREIRFFDDTFTFDRAHVEAICEGMRARPVPWTCLTRVANVDREMLAMMRRSHCWQVLYGLESGDDGVLARIGKGTTVEQNRKAVLWAHEAGLSVRADFLVGTPWETPQTLERTLAFAKGLPLDMAHFNKFVPYPGTAIYRSLVREGRKIEFDNGAYINNHCQFDYVPGGLDLPGYISFLNRSYREFYLRPSYLARRLISLRSFEELRGHIDGFFSIVSL